MISHKRQESGEQGAPLPAVPKERGIHPRSAEDEILHTADTAAHMSKMISGGEELRDHDFPYPSQAGERANQRVAEGEGIPEPEQVHSGGKIGEIVGDTQRKGEIGAIMDQVLMTPDFAQEIDTAS
jgi:hypothetical protein